MSDGFLGRWSRRKQEAREGRDKAPDLPAEPTPEKPLAAPTPVAAPLASSGLAPGAPSELAPTLAEAQALTPASDFSRFVSRAVAPEVRNAAMKRLFRDPHFNVMDGLDTYIGDYSGADPIPLATLRKLASAKFLGMVPAEDESASQTAAQPGPTPPDPEIQDTPLAPDVAQSQGDLAHHEQAAVPHIPSPATASPTPHAHAHLRLQSDHAPPDGQSGDGDR